MSQSKSSRLDLRVTPEQKELLERAATLKGVSLSAYTLFYLIPIAKKEIEQQERLILSNQDRDLFLSTLENPPPLQGRLKEAIEQYQTKYGNELTKMAIFPSRKATSTGRV
ncbi:MAG: DUF1778 domain-containing protein [Symploca sp. SIO3E6]|nr:DUF1778 domain-containing protein [Caldora sp. SIO3E6]